MAANAAQFFVSIAGAGCVNFDVVRFTGADIISVPYCFDVYFRLSKTGRKEGAAPPGEGAVGGPCRFGMHRNGSVIAYCGIVTEFRSLDADVKDEGRPAYMIRLMPAMQRLSLNFTSRVFRKMTAVEIIETVIEGAGLGGYFRFDIGAKYPQRDYCVQYQETDLDFVSRLMEESGIWYWFEQAAADGADEASGSLSAPERFESFVRERAVVTDKFGEFPPLEGEIPFMRGGGFAEIVSAGGDIAAAAGGAVSAVNALTGGKSKAAAMAGSALSAAGGAAASVAGAGSKLFGEKIAESISSLSATRKLSPQSVHVRAYNYRSPNSAPEALRAVRGGGDFGCVYEYGGAFKNSAEAERRARLHAERLYADSRRMDGKSNCASFAAGRRANIRHDGDSAKSGNFLLVSVKHTGGWIDGAYSYGNEFSCVNAEGEVYAPPLRVPAPKIGGIITAPVAATGGCMPTLEEDYGCYSITPSFAKGRGGGNKEGGGAGGCGASKWIRVAQPSCGAADGEEDRPYGMHFPVKRGAEMVLAYVGGNPDKPIGLGFVPNAASPSVVRGGNNLQNIMRSWGGSELVMDDTDGQESVRLSTPAKRDTEPQDGAELAGGKQALRYMELHDGDGLVRVRSAFCELLFNDEKKFAQVDAGGHIIYIDYNEDRGEVSIETAKGVKMVMADKDGSVSVSNTAHNGNGAISLESRGNISLKAGGNICIEAGGAVAVSGQSALIRSDKAEISIEAAKSMNITAEDITQESRDFVKIKTEKSLDINAKDITAEASRDINIEGKEIEIYGTGALSMQSNDTTVTGKSMVTIESEGQAKVESGGPLLIKSNTKAAIESQLVTIN